MAERETRGGSTDSSGEERRIRPSCLALNGHFNPEHGARWNVMCPSFVRPLLVDKFVFKPGQGIVDTDEEKPWDVALYVYQEFWQAKNNPDRKAYFFTGATLGPDNPQFAQYSFTPTSRPLVL